MSKEREELERLMQRQAALQEELARLGQDLTSLQARLVAPAITPGPVATALPQSPTKEPWAGQDSRVTSSETPPPTARPLATPPPLPPIIPPSPVSVAAETHVRPDIRAAEPEFTAAADPSARPAPEATAPASRAAGSFEMRLGTYWLVRVGIVMLLTGMVFLGNYAYKNYVGKLGPAGKVALLYLVSGALLGLGAWLHRKQEKLKNYAQVLFAGGLAGVYFTTYAAHHIENLRVINNAWLDGALLLGWAGFIVWLADRKQSEVLALFAVGLGYYTSVMTNIGQFTLFSNLVLTLAAVFFLVRNRWAALSFLSLVATYVAYAFWRFYHQGDWRWASPGEGLWNGNYFLMSYWVLFTTAVFLSRDEAFARQQRVPFLSLNNAAFFSMFILTMLQVRHGGFWKFSLSFGVVLLGLAALARRMFAPDKQAENAYLTQGLLLVTLGFLTYFTGFKLALVLAVESAVLVILGAQFQNRVLQIGSVIVAVLAVSGQSLILKKSDPTGLYSGAGIGAVMLFNALWLRLRQEKAGGPGLLWQRQFFGLLALAVWLAVTWVFTPQPYRAPLLAGEAVLFTALGSRLRLPEVALFSQFFLILGQLQCLVSLSATRASVPWWSPAGVIVIAVALSHWWQRQTTIPSSKETQRWFQGLSAIAAVSVLFFWLETLLEAPVWLACASLFAVVLTIYGALTRAWFLAAFGQLFLVASLFQFIRQLYAEPSYLKPEWYLALAPVAALSLLSLAALKWLNRHPADNAVAGEPINTVSRIYRGLAVLTALGWIFNYVPSPHRFWVLMLVGGLFFLWSVARKLREPFGIGAIFSVVGLMVFWVRFKDPALVHWPNLLAILFLFVQQQAARRLGAGSVLPWQVHPVMILLGGCSLWLYLSRWVVLKSGGAHFFLTVGWAILALLIFGAGFALRERVHRWMGLAILACALGRVVLFDVWRLETIYRIASFMALGVVLLVLGFIYNKYQEKIREWL